MLIQGWKNVASQSFYYAGYAQDDWRVTSKLTLNLGVRYDYDSPRTERYNRMNYLRSRCGLAAGVESPAVPRPERRCTSSSALTAISRHQYFKDTNNLAPRLGLAYQFNEKTVIRAGYAPHLRARRIRRRRGRSAHSASALNIPWQTTIDGITPFNLLRNPYPLGFRPLARRR